MEEKKTLLILRLEGALQSWGTTLNGTSGTVGIFQANPAL